jgi:acyl-CoA oxidase
VKKEAIGLVDAFQFSDGALKTLIGCHDGRPYEKIFEWATTKNSMNLSHPSIAKAIENVK